MSKHKNWIFEAIFNIISRKTLGSPTMKFQAQIQELVLNLIYISKKLRTIAHNKTSKDEKKQANE